MKGMLTLAPLPPRRTTTGHNLKYYIYRLGYPNDDKKVPLEILGIGLVKWDPK
jgi:hypothetical protein